MNTYYVLAAILVMSVTTVLLRAVPFLLPKQSLEHPLAQRLARIMPLIIMVTLVAHSFKGATWSAGGSAMPLVVGVVVTGAIQYIFRIPLLSILSGLAIHVALVNFA